MAIPWPCDLRSSTWTGCDWRNQVPNSPDMESHFTLSIHIYTCGAYDCRIWKEMFVWKWHSHPFEVRLIVKSSMMTRYTSESSKHLILALNPLASHPCTPCQTIWLIVSTHRKHIGQLGSSSQDGREIHIICIYICVIIYNHIYRYKVHTL